MRTGPLTRGVPCAPARPQYRSGVYVHSPEQAEAAKKAIERWQKRFSSPIVTEVVDVAMYHPAEEYHQKCEWAGNIDSLYSCTCVWGAGGQGSTTKSVSWGG